MRILAIIFALTASVHGQMLQSIVNSSSSPTGPGSFTLVNTSPVSFPCVGTTTTCSVPLIASVSSGHLLTIECKLNVYTSVVSASAGGTVVPVFSASAGGNSNTLWPADAYIYPTTSTAGPIVLTFGASIGTSASSSCTLREYSVSVGTPKLDHGQSVLKAYGPATSIAGITPAFSGTKDVVVQSENNDAVATTGVTTYTNGKFDAVNGPGFGDLENTTSTSPPGWTVTSSTANAAVNDMAFATDATSCRDINYIDFSGSTSGTTVTASLLNASDKGLPVTGASTNQGNGWALSVTPSTGITFLSGSPTAYHSSVRLCNGGAVTGANGFYLQYDWSNATPKFVQFGYLGTHKCSVSGYVNSSFPVTDTTFHDMGGCGAVSKNFVTFQRGASGTQQQMRLECFGAGGTTNFSSTVNTTINTDTFFTMKNDDAVGGTLELCSDSTCTTVTAGPVTCAAMGWTVAVQDTYILGQVGGTADFPTAVEKYGPSMFDPTGTFPLVTP